MSFEVRSIRNDEREECIALWCTVWPADNSDSYFRRYFYGDVEWLPYYTRVGMLNGQLVSAVQICKRIVACGEYRLTMGGIANVATLPDQRGHGYNTQCLRSAIEVMEADAMDFALLFTGINDYYARQGFSTLPRNWLSGTIRQDFVARPTGYVVRNVCADDIDSVHRIYDTYNRERPIAVQRTAAYWRDWLGISASRLPTELLIAVDSMGTVRGYVRCGTFRSAVPYSADAEGIRIIELGVDRRQEVDTEPDVTQALLDAVAMRTLESGGNTLRLDLWAEPAIRESLAGILSDRHEHNNMSGMVRLLHRENLLRGFTMQWNERWTTGARPGGVLKFATPYGPVRIDATGALLCVQSCDDAVGQMSQEALFGLLFGFLTPEQATDRPDLWPLLTALFPPQAATYYGMDGF